MSLRRGWILLVGCAASAASAALAAPTVTIYRCVASDGTVTIQNAARCPKGTQEQRRVMETAQAPDMPSIAPATPRPVAMAPMPATGTIAAMPAMGPTTAPALMPSAPNTVPTSSATGTPAPGESIALRPAPMLYLCLAGDAQRYYGDDAEGTRCAPLATTGLGGTTTGAGQACEVVRDRCEPVPEAERCAAWAERRRTAEQAALFQPEQGDAARADLDRVDAATSGTVCGR